MGLFDKLRGNQELSLSPQGGLLLSALTMIGADGNVDDDELAIIRRLDGTGKTEAWDAALRAWKTRPVGECISIATAAMNPEQRLMAIANLIDIAMADGHLAGAEQSLLEDYVTAFGVPEADVERMVGVIAIKNDRSVF